MSEEKIEFDIGDIVEFAGTEGEVFRINSDISDRYLSVCFGPSHMQKICFQKDGKLWDWQKDVSLKLVRKAKKKMKIEAWANVYHSDSYTIHTTKELAERAGMESEGRSFCVKLVSEEGVEV